MNTQVDDDLETILALEVPCEGNHSDKLVHDDGPAQWRFVPNCASGCTSRLVCDGYRTYFINLSNECEEEQCALMCPYCSRFIGLEWAFLPLT